MEVQIIVPTIVPVVQVAPSTMSAKEKKGRIKRNHAASVHYNNL